MCHTSKAYQVLIEPKALDMWANAVPMELMLSACRYYQTKLLGRRGKRVKIVTLVAFWPPPTSAPYSFPPLAWCLQVSLDFSWLFDRLPPLCLPPDADETSLFSLFVLLHQSPTAATIRVSARANLTWV
ncbi:hypothetical protein H0G86_006104 [Trichoderma simmonsii]|uniref:Uncharacterized protein n=1 Tax=Trichoderma simmonsii TaxID=1491479 RepID=A0A8G0LAU5_9HYPO|nr:hypothetical protein H0G86_006104 [Trichoderma simmonsii]